jgi:hypothetical protein
MQHRAPLIPTDIAWRIIHVLFENRASLNEAIANNSHCMVIRWDLAKAAPEALRIEINLC